MSDRPMFPFAGGAGSLAHLGITVREFACIMLRVPATGDAELDAIIRRAQLDEFAGKALIVASIGGAIEGTEYEDANVQAVTRLSYKIAAAMLAESERRKKDE